MMGVIQIAVLCVFPGAWIAFAPRRSSWGPVVRLAMAVALSPVVVAVEYYAIRAMGVSFARTAGLLPAINVPAVVLMVRAWRGQTPPHLRGGVNLTWAVAVLLVVAGCIAAPWIIDPVFARFSWHGLMHTDICYAIARGGLVPEEPELAGVRLGYPWFGHIYWAVMGATARVSPLQLYGVTNLVFAGATGVLCYTACRELGASPMVALWCPVWVALGPNLVGLAGWSIFAPNDNGLYWAVLGDLRYAPFVQKYVSFEVMPFGLTLLAAMMLAVIVGLRRTSRFELLLVPVMLLAIAGLYPNVYPPAAVLAAAVPMALWWYPSMTNATYHRRFVMILAGLVMVCALAGVVLVKFFTAGRETPTLGVSSVAAAGKKLVAAVVALTPFVWAGWQLWKRQDRSNRGALAVLGVASAASLMLNVGLRLDGLHEYKFFMCAGLLITVAAIAGVELALPRVAAHPRAVLVASLAVLAVVMGVYGARRTPHFSDVVPATRSDGFHVALDDSAPDAGWTAAVRNRTPPDTILVVYKPDVHVSSFAARSLWVPSEGDTVHCGYNMRGRFNMVSVRGYSAGLVDRQLAVLGQIYTDADPDCAALVGALTESGRPVAIVFHAGCSLRLLAWLCDQGVGETVFEKPGEATVHLITPRGA